MACGHALASLCVSCTAKRVARCVAASRLPAGGRRDCIRARLRAEGLCGQRGGALLFEERHGRPHAGQGVGDQAGRRQLDANTAGAAAAARRRL
eukprot:1344466-Pleurochrysis_carterae.AAC.1